MSNRIGLAEAIESLRLELEEAILSGVDQSLNFEVGEIELELQIEIASESEMGGGIKAWVVEATVGSTESKSYGHSVTIPLTPVSKNGTKVLTGQSSKTRPK